MDDQKRSKMSDRIGQFVAVPVSFINDSRISLRAFRLFVILRSYTSANDGRDMVFPGYETLRARCGFGSYTFVALAVRELEKAGWIERRKRFGKPTYYFLTQPVLQTGVEMDAPPVLQTGVASVLHPSVATVLQTGVEELEPKNQKKKYPEVERPRRKVLGFASVFTEHPDPRISAFLEILARKQITVTDAEIIQNRVSATEMDAWREALTAFAREPNWQLRMENIIDRYDRIVNSRRIASKSAPPNYQNGAYKHAMPDTATGAMEILRARAAARGETI